MYETVRYDRNAAVNYALKWAFDRNPAYLDFHGLGGDCTNFVSQCIFAGTGIMNYQKDVGWYYRSASDRAAAWTGVEYLNRFLTKNLGAGPFAEEVSVKELEAGDVVQFGDENYHFFHSAIVTVPGNDIRSLFVASHSYDTAKRKAESYSCDVMRFLKILGARR